MYISVLKDSCAPSLPVRQSPAGRRDVPAARAEARRFPDEAIAVPIVRFRTYPLFHL